jgi:hypothetical protein
MSQTNAAEFLKNAKQDVNLREQLKTAMSLDQCITRRNCSHHQSGCLPATPHQSCVIRNLNEIHI